QDPWSGKGQRVYGAARALKTVSGVTCYIEVQRAQAELDELLALGGVPDGEDDLDFEIRRVLSEWFLPLIDLTVSYRETGAPEGEAAFQALLCDLMEAGWQADLEAIVPARGAAFDPVIHEAVGPTPTGDARVARVESPGYRIGGGIMRLARVHLEQ
ncbi:MAG TPA: nucleotide exchange factor GrpE, partial [Armatimonadota bacterium]|nr:nucleotide exchange factor GrpE [Armatimonadota bacterium]